VVLRSPTHVSEDLWLPVDKGDKTRRGNDLTLLGKANDLLRARNVSLFFQELPMALSRKDKEQLVQAMTASVKGATSVVVFSFRALPVKHSAALRRNLRGADGTVEVIKKRLFKRVATEVGMPANVGGMEGSVAVVWSGDLIAPAKLTQELSKTLQGVRIEGGLLEGAFLSREDVERLAALPSAHELRGQLVSVLVGPIRGFAGVLAATIRGLPGVLQAIATKQGGAGA
jgi:large subunit ribosomal protein L10